MTKHNKINYIEFQANDLEVIKGFYSATFGWTFTDYGPTYVAFNDGLLDGGFEKGDKRGAAPLIILYSNNLEQTQVDVEKNGGSIVKPIFSFPGGRRFHFTDPHGNELAVWSE